MALSNVKKNLKKKAEEARRNSGAVAKLKTAAAQTAKTPKYYSGKNAAGTGAGRKPSVSVTTGTRGKIPKNSKPVSNGAVSNVKKRATYQAKKTSYYSGKNASGTGIGMKRTAPVVTGKSGKVKDNQRPLYYRSRDNAQPVRDNPMKRKSDFTNVKNLLQEQRGIARNTLYRSRDDGTMRKRYGNTPTAYDYSWQSKQQDRKSKSNQRALEQYAQAKSGDMQQAIRDYYEPHNASWRNENWKKLRYDYANKKIYLGDHIMTQEEADRLFPFGSSNPEDRRLLEEAGYQIHSLWPQTVQDASEERRRALGIGEKRGSASDLGKVEDPDLTRILGYQEDWAKAKEAGNKEAMANAHKKAEAIRAKYGYSGGDAGDQTIRGDVSMDEYKQLNHEGDAALSMARLKLSRAVTEEEKAKAEQEIQAILSDPEYQADEANRLKLLTSSAVKGGIGGTLHMLEGIGWGAENIARGNAMPQWIEMAAEIPDLEAELKTIDEAIATWGYDPMNRNRSEIEKRLKRAKAAEAEIERAKTDKHSDFYVPPDPGKVWSPGTTTPTRWEKMIQEGQNEYQRATEGWNAAQKFGADLYANAIQMAPTTLAALIPGAQGTALGAIGQIARGASLASMSLSAGGQRMYELQQRGVPQAEAERGGLAAAGIEYFTEKLPMEYLHSIATGSKRAGIEALKTAGISSAIEGTEEGLSYAGNAAYSYLMGYREDAFSASEMARDMLAGGIMGGFHAGVGVAMNHAINHFIGQGDTQAPKWLLEQADEIDRLLQESEDYKTLAAQGVLSEQEHVDIQDTLRSDLETKLQQIQGVMSQIKNVKSMTPEETEQLRSALGTDQESFSRQDMSNLVGLTLSGQMKANRMMENRGETTAERQAREQAEMEARARNLVSLGRTVIDNSTGPVREAPRTLEEAAEMKTADQVPTDIPPVTYERSRFPMTSVIGSLIDSHRETQARKARDEQVAAERAAAQEMQTQEVRTPQAPQVQQAQMPQARSLTNSADMARSSDPVIRTAAMLGVNGGKAIQRAALPVTGNESRLMFSRGFVQVYNQALSGKTNIRRPYFMNETQFNIAVDSAMRDRKAGLSREILNSQKAAGHNRNAGLDMSDAYVKGLDRQTVKLMDKVAKDLGVRVQFVEEGSLIVGDSAASVDGGKQTANADISGNVVRIEKNNPNPVLALIGHELTHRMQDVSPEAYRAFRDYVMQIPGQAEIVQSTMEAYRRRGANINMEGAMDEVAANFAGNLFNSSAELQRFIRENRQNRTLLQRILDVFRDIAAKLTGRERAQADEAVRLLEEALGAASERVGRMARMGDTAADIDETDPDMDPTRRHSISSGAQGAGFEAVKNEKTGMIEFWRDGKKVDHVTPEMLEEEGAIGMMIKLARDDARTITAEQARVQLQGWADLLNLILKTQDSELVWEFAGAELFSAVKANSDKQYKSTIDFGTICVKTQDMIDAMSDAMYRLGRGLTKDEITGLQKKLKLNQATVPCPVCYVFSRWAGVGGLLDNMKKWHYKYLNMTDAEVQSAMRQLERAQTEGAKESARTDEEYGPRYRGYEAVIADKSASEEDKKRAKKEMKAIEKIMKRRALSESDEEFHDLMSQAEELETKVEKISDELRELKRTAKSRRENATEIELKEKSKAKFKERLKECNAAMKKIESSGGPELSWLKRVRTKPDYFEKGVFRGEDGKILEGREFDKVIFDLNATERWVTEAPLLWEYRKSRGAGLGKAILPYSDFTFGDLILGDKNNSASGTTTWQKVGKTLTKTQANSYKKARNRLLAQKWMGGQRFQSTSDFRYDYALDYLQAFLELQALGGSIQTYTKVIEFADMVTKIHGDVNMSVMPLGRGYDENGKLMYSDLTGINADEAIKLRNKTDSAQLILVGINDNHIRLAMQDSEESGGIYVDFIIPYHPSGASIDQFIAQLVQNLGEDYDAGNYQNYEVVQNDVERDDITAEQARRADLRKKLLTRSEKVGKKAKPWSPSEGDMDLINRRSKNIRGKSFEELLDIETRALNGDRKAIREYESWSAGVLNNIYQAFWADEKSEYNGVNLSNDQADMIMPNEYWDTKTTRDTAYINGFIFRSLCYSLGLHPRFTGWSSNGRVDHGDFRDQKGYWKTLIDRRMYDHNGKYRRQEAVNITDISGKEHFDMLAPAYGQEHYGNVRTQQPDNEKALRASEKFVAEVQSEVGTRFSISAQTDSDYMAAVERGDMETARRMVDEAAKVAGYNVKVYHGTTQEMQSASRGRLTGKEYDQLEKDYADKLFPFVVFKSGIAHAGIYTATDRGVAEDFMFSFSHGGTVFDLYARTKNPLVVDAGGKGWNNIPRDAADAVGLTSEILRGLDSYKKTRNKNNIYIDDLVEYAKKRGYDGVVVENVRETGFGDEDSPITTDVIVFDPNQVKSADPVTYDDDGNVIPLSERFDAETGDIRYSIGTGGFDQAKLMRENQLLRDRVEYWKGQTKRSDRTKADPKEVKKLARKLAGDFSTTMDTAEISGQLQAIYDGLGKDWTYDQAYEAAHSLAREMVEQASESDGFLYNEYEPLRKFFRENPLVISPEIKRGITDYNEWRKAQMGRLIIKHGDQSNVDQVYQELSQLWPEWFDEERDVSSLDQLERIAEVMDSIYAREEQNPFGDDLEGPAGYLAAEIMERFWDMPNVKRTYADRAEARLGREVTRRLDMQEKYQEKLQQVREDRDKKLKQKSEEYLGKKRAASQRQKERERRAQIMRHARELSKKLLKPSDKQHIPQQLREAVAAVLDSVNLSSKNFKDTNRTRAFQELRLAYQEVLQQGESLVIDPDLMDNIMEVEAMRDTPIAEMNLSQLETIWKTIRAVEASITTANRAFGQQRFATIFEAADGLRQAMQSRRDRGDYRGPAGAFDKLLNSGMLTPESYFHRMGETGQDIFRMLRNAQDKHIGIMQEAQDYTEGALFEKFLKEKPSKNPVRKAAQDEKLRKMQRKMEKEIHTFDFDGQKVQLTTAQIMSLYELMKRKQAVDHITVGGIKPEGIEKGIRSKTPSEPYRLTLDQISEIVDSLTEEQMQMADALQKFMSGRLSELGNEASMAVYGYKKFTEKHYFPIKVDKNQTVTDQTKEAQAATIAGRGFTKSTTPKANNALIVRNIFDVYADHVTDMATYSSWLEAMENLQRIYNFTFRDADNNRTGTTKGYLERAFGRNGLSYWEKLTEDLNNGVHGTNDNPFNALIGNYKASAIGANIRVFIQQPTAILRALDDINPVDFLAGLGRGTVFTTWKKVKKYAPIAVWKDWGYFDADTGRQMKSILFGDDSALAKVNNTMMAPAGFMDSVGWSHIWNALEAETRRTRKDLKPRTEAFYQAVAARFNAVIDHSQVVDGILQRSQVMRSPDALTKMATSFMAEPTKVYNMFTTAVYDLKHSQDPKARTQAMKVLGRTTFALIASFFANAAAQSLVDALRDDDKNEEYWEKFVRAFFGLEGNEETTGEKIKNGVLRGNLEQAFNPVTYIPYVKDVLSVWQGFKVTRMDMDSISKFSAEIATTWKAFNGDGKITLRNALTRLTAEGARLLGIPASNIKRDVLAIYSTVMNSQKNYLGQFELQKWLYRIDGENNQTDFVKIAYAAQQAGDTEAYEKIKAELIDVMGQDKFDKKMKNLGKKELEAGGDHAEDFDRVYGTYETQMAGNPLYSEMPAEEKAKVEASLKQYASDQVMYDASSGEITSNDTEMAAIKEAEAAGIDPVTYKSFRVYYNGLASDKDENGKDIPGQTKQDKTIRAIEELELSNEQSSYLYHTCYSSDANNPWA